MTNAEVNAFYRELDVAEHTGRPAWELAEDYASRALQAGRVEGFDTTARVLARVAFRFAERYDYRTRTYNLATRGVHASETRARNRMERLQRAADTGYDTWEEYHGEK